MIVNEFEHIIGLQDPTRVENYYVRYNLLSSTGYHYTYPLIFRAENEQQTDFLIEMIERGFRGETDPLGMTRFEYDRYFEPVPYERYPYTEMVKDDLRRIGFQTDVEETVDMCVTCLDRRRYAGSSKTIPDSDNIPGVRLAHTLLQTGKEFDFIDQDLYPEYTIDLHNEMFSPDPEQRRSTWFNHKPLGMDNS